MCERIPSKNHPLVSIVVLNWNGLVYLEKCLQSLQCLTYPNYEVIVVDNGSSDGSPDIVKRDFQNVRLIANDCNLGVAKANNIGIKAAKGDFVVLFNNDVVADPLWLFELVKTVVQSPKIGIASGVILQGKPSDILWEAGKSIDVFTGATWRIGYGDKLNKLGKAQDIDFFSTCAALIRKDLVKKIGLIDEGYFIYGEDADWAFSARRAGYECRLVPSAIVWHEGSASTKTIPSKRFYWLNLSNFRLYFKQFPLEYLFSALIFQLIFVSFLQVTLFGCPVTYMPLKLKAFILNVANLPKTMVERKKVECLGELHLKPRLRGLLKVVMAREKGREF
jgi:GT2 family glycosyltransferase